LSSPDPSLPTESLAAPAPLNGASASLGENPPWNLWDVLRIAVAAMIAIGLFSMIAMALASHGIKSRELLEKLARNPKVAVPPQIAAYLVVIGYMIAIPRMAGRPFLKAIQWNYPGPAAIAYGTLGVALAILISTTSALLPIPKSLPIDNYFTDTAGAYLMAFFGITFAPLVEELFFRGFLYPVLARSLGVGISVAITALCFALIHAAQLAHAWAPLLLLWLVGLALTSVRAWTKSVAASFCVHAGYNLTLFTLMFLATDHFRHLEKLR
jgi:membrane protease YdiL (CAAX protease family)